MEISSLEAETENFIITCLTPWLQHLYLIFCADLVTSFSIRARTGTTLTHWWNVPSVHFIAPLSGLYTFFISVHAITLIWV